MAFGDTGILDNFNRADSSSTIGGNWTQMMRTGSVDFGISSNQAYNPDANWNAVYYDASTYGPDCECYVTLATLQPQTYTFIMYLRMKEVTADAYTYDGYGMHIYRWDNGGTDTMRLIIKRIDNSSETTLGATVNFTGIADGDKAGFSAVDSTLKGYYDTGGGWAEKLSRTDSTYSASGYFAFYQDDNDSSTRWDDFGGGVLDFEISTSDSITVGESVNIVLPDVGFEISISDSITISEAVNMLLSDAEINTSDSITIGEAVNVSIPGGGISIPVIMHHYQQQGMS